MRESVWLHSTCSNFLACLAWILWVPCYPMKSRVRHCFLTGHELSLFSVTTHFMLAAFFVRLSLNSLWILLAACEVGTSPFCGLLTHRFYNLHHWLICWYLKFFEDFSVDSCLISFRVFVKEQFCMFSLLLEFSDCVCFHHWFWFPVSSCCLLSHHQSRPTPPTPILEAVVYPSISPPPSPHLLWS